MPSSSLAARFTRRIAKSSFGGEAYAFGEIIGQTELVADFYGQFRFRSPPPVSVEACGRLSSHLQKKGVAGRYLVRHFSAIQDMSNRNILRNILQSCRCWNAA